MGGYLREGKQEGGRPDFWSFLGNSLEPSPCYLDLCCRSGQVGYMLTILLRCRCESNVGPGNGRRGRRPCRLRPDPTESRPFQRHVLRAELAGLEVGSELLCLPLCPAAGRAWERRALKSARVWLQAWAGSPGHVGPTRLQRPCFPTSQRAGVWLAGASELLWFL